MAFNATACRRWLGILFLGGAVLMLALGQTALRDRLSALAFLLYWMVCFGFTGLAVTLGSILTLFAVMQMTGRIRWSERFQGAPGVRT